MKGEILNKDCFVCENLNSCSLTDIVHSNCYRFIKIKEDNNE